MLGLDRSWGSVLTSGGSSANLIGLAVGRNELLLRLGWNVRKQGLYGAPPIIVNATEEGNSSLIKAVELLGIGRNAIRHVPLDPRARMDVDVLASMLGRDPSVAGIVCAGAETVNTGAVDPFHTSQISRNGIEPGSTLIAHTAQPARSSLRFSTSLPVCSVPTLSWSIYARGSMSP